MLGLIRRLEPPLILAFDRSRLMVLPQAMAKSVRLSTYSTIGIGDAENDHDLFDACEVDIAVEWGSPSLRVVDDKIWRFAMSHCHTPSIAGFALLAAVGGKAR